MAPNTPNFSNWNETHQRARSLSKRLASEISRFIGSVWFAYAHLLWFSAWILIPIEPFPFHLLTTIVSLEAILLSIFIMINVNDAADRASHQADEDFITNIRTWNQISMMLSERDFDRRHIETIITLINEKQRRRGK